MSLNTFRLKLAYLASVMFVFLAGQHVYGQLVSEPVALPDDLHASAPLRWADLDGDGDFDIVARWAGYYEYRLKIYENVNQSFVEVSNPFNGTYQLANFDLGDYDADGDVDILIVDNQTLKIASNTGHLSFALQSTTMTDNMNPPAAHWQDLDGDLDLDIVLDHLLFVNDQGAYTKALRELPEFIHEVAWADLNNDGFADFVGTRFETGDSNPLYLYLNAGDGSFKETASFPGSVRVSQLRWLDVDADKDLDLLVADFHDKCKLYVNSFAQSGTVTLTPSFTFDELGLSLSAVGDVDRDGRTDVVLSGATSEGDKNTFLYRNTSTVAAISFEVLDLKISTHDSWNLTLIDKDNDLDLDLFLTAANDIYGDDTFRKFYEFSYTAITGAPSGPTNLASQSGKNITLSWDFPMTNLYANVEVKRNGAPYNAALVTANGKYLFPGLASPCVDKKVVLHGLPEGSYEWRVQAIDAANRSSAFSSLQSFTITAPPTALTLTAIEYNQVKLDWSYAGSAQNGFAVFRRSTNTPLTEIGTTSAGVKTFTDKGIPSSEHVEYLVEAIVGKIGRAHV